MSLFGREITTTSVVKGAKRAEPKRLDPDLTFRMLIRELFDPEKPQEVITRMGPTWYAEGIRRIEEGAETVEALFQESKWKLKN